MVFLYLCLKYRSDAKKEQHIHQAQSGGDDDGRDNDHLNGTDNIIPAGPYDLPQFRVGFFDKLNQLVHNILIPFQAQ
jgi:hypothetical protein